MLTVRTNSSGVPSARPRRSPATASPSTDGAAQPAIRSVNVTPGRRTGGPDGRRAVGRPRPLHPRSSATSSAARSASAEMVSSGLTARGRGTMAPSATTRPSWTSPFTPVNTRPAWSTTPAAPSSAIGQPPRGCTVTSESLNIGVDRGLPTKLAPREALIFWSTSALRSNTGRSPAPAQSTRTLSPSSRSRPSPASSLMTRYVSVSSAAPPRQASRRQGLRRSRRQTRRANATGPPPPPASDATAKAAGISGRSAPGMAPSSTSSARDRSAVRSTMPVMQGPTLVSGVGWRRPVPMPRTGTSASYANARTSPLPLNRDPSRGETARPSERDRMRIWVDPSVPAASTTTSANTNEAGAPRR